MSKTKHNPPKKPKPDFIEFSELQQDYLNEVRNRQVKEFNAAVDKVCKALGITEKLKQAPPGMMYKLRMNDLSGIDIVPAPPDPPDPPKDN